MSVTGDYFDDAVERSYNNGYDDGWRDALEAAAAFIDEVARRAIGRAVEPIGLPWLAGRIRQVAALDSDKDGET